MPRVNIVEGQIPGSITCTSDGSPTTTFEWKLNNHTLAKDKSLLFNKAIMRNESGPYTCIASNRHGSATEDMTFNVQCMYPLLKRHI